MHLPKEACWEEFLKGKWMLVKGFSLFKRERSDTIHTFFQGNSSLDWNPSVGQHFNVPLPQRYINLLHMQIFNYSCLVIRFNYNIFIEALPKIFFETMVSKGLSSPPIIYKPPFQGSPRFPKIWNISLLKRCCLDWWCFLSWIGSHETLPVILKCFHSEQYWINAKNI